MNNMRGVMQRYPTMNDSTLKKPKSATLLYENLFSRRDRSITLNLLSEGGTAVIANVQRLLDDASLLVESERFASASFLLATANEEMAKSYILLDACRLDFSQYQSVLKKLCWAFYDHVAKYAYMEIINFSRFHDMAHVKEMWAAKVTRWWPATDDPECGEPDMPHETHFTREIPLYIDFIDYDQYWFVPDDNLQKYIFEDNTGGRALSKAKEDFGRLMTTAESGLFRSECLSDLNEIFSCHYLTDKTPTETVFKLYEKAAQLIEHRQGIAKDKFFESALHVWPLYHFVAI